MPIANLALPRSVHSAVFLAVVAILKADPTLARFVKTWVVWDGTLDNLALPTLAECPWVSITPVADPSRWETVGQHNSALSLKVEVRLEGSRVTDAMDAWGAIKAALFPDDQSVLQKLEAAGGLGYQISQPSYGVGPDPEGDGVMMAGDGMLKVLILLDTPV